MAVTINASTSAGLVQTADTSGVLQLQTAGTTAVTVDASQRAAFVAGTAALPAITTTGDTNTGMFFPAADTIAFAEGGTEIVRIDSSGRILFGTTDTNVTNGAVVIQDLNAVNSYIKVGHKTGSVNGADFIAFYYNNTQIGGCAQSGTTAVAYNTSSDYRLKENIVPMTGALDKVTQLKPVTYTWKLDGSDGQGFIAHELAEIVPDCVTGEKDAVETYTDEDGNEQTRPKYQGVDTSFLVATLTAAIQEQQTIINDLKARVTALEAK
jgi:hypothetical protein